MNMTKYIYIHINRKKKKSKAKNQQYYIPLTTTFTYDKAGNNKEIVTLTCQMLHEQFFSKAKQNIRYILTLAVFRE